MQILLVENHDATAQGVALLLSTWGHDATVVSLATEARAACAARGFDLIICDLGLPYEGGLELMRGLSGQCATPAIALSGYTRPKDVRDSLDAGFSEHLGKPVNTEKLEAAIRRVTRRPA